MTDFLRPLLVNKYERAADVSLRNIALANDDRLVPKVRVADVLDVDMLVSGGDRWSMLASHFDFVMYRGERPIFVVEIDGLSHVRDPEKHTRDRRKDALCDSAALPFVRVATNLVLRREGQMTILEYIVDAFYLFEAFWEAQKSGSIPLDEPFDRGSINVTAADGTVTGGLDAEAVRYMSSCEQAGKIPARVPDITVVNVPERRNVRALAYLAVASDQFLMSEAEVRDFRFIGLTPGELAENLTITALGAQVKGWLADRPVVVKYPTLAKKVLEIQKYVDNGNFISASTSSRNLQVAGRVPPFSVRFAGRSRAER